MKTILPIHLGGTIASRDTGAAGQTAEPDMEFAELYDAVVAAAPRPVTDALRKSSVLLADRVALLSKPDGTLLPYGKDSSTMVPADVQQTARLILDNYSKYDGFLITHGTDTLAYSSTLLSFMLAGIDKPVVLTGSQLMLSDAGTDVPTNFLDAWKACATGKRGVWVSFDGKVIRGSRARKRHSSDRDGFDAGGPDPVTIEEFVCSTEPPMAASWQPGESARIELDERVRIEFLTPATAAGELEDRIKRAKTRGVVALAYGLGGQRSEVWDALKASGAAVLLKTQCPFGETNPDKYLVGEGARSFMNARTMTIEACFSKLMWSLANFGDNEVRHVIETDIAGEF